MMSLNGNPPSGLVIPKTPKSARRLWFILAILLLTPVVLFLAIGSKIRASWARLGAPPRLQTVLVDEGDMDMIVTENGTLESANNATARCQVEALIGTVGGAQGAMGAGGQAGGQGGNRGGAQGGAQAGGQAGAGGQQGQNPQQQQQQQQPQAKTKAGTGKAGAAKAGAGAAKAGTAKAGAAGGAAAAGNTAAAGGANAQGGTTGGANAQTGTTASKKPTIRSFTYQVTPHTPLRPKVVAQPVQQKAQVMDPAMGGRGGGGGGRGGGGGGRGGGRGGANDPTAMEKPGSTRILSILPEGTRVKAGDIVCELDSSAFRDELQAQRIRHIQAKAYVEQAKALLEVSEITLREYRDGIYPQDQSLIHQYITTCRTEDDRARRNYAWSEATTKKGYRSDAQLKADLLALQQAQIALREAEGMSERLEKYTAPMLIKELAAKVEAIRADQFAQQQAFEVESDRLKKLETMVANCTMRAPRDGIVVYANQSNSWGQVETQIDEGVTVREGQAIFHVPDPLNMQVRAKINESKVAQVHSGLPVLIRVDAFPDQPLQGTLTEITPIPAPGNRASDIRVYTAVVKIATGGFEDLRPGLSAEITIRVGGKRRVTRVPLQAIRWAGSQAFAAIETNPDPNSPSGLSWRWNPITIGMSDTGYAEVINGLKPGDRVIANAGALPRPRLVPARSPSKDVARAEPPARDKS
jgi:multidrug resistance efflux pump